MTCAALNLTHENMIKVIMRNTSLDYIKHIYWLTKAEQRRLRDEMAARQEKIASARGIPCRPLNEKVRLAIVDPEDWNKACTRQGSWYRNSTKNGLYLVISAFEIEAFEEKREGIITPSDFTPGKRASREEKEKMIEAPEFRNRVPGEWYEVDEKEKKIALKWAKRFGSKVTDYDLLFLSSTANHSNFIIPGFFIKDDRGIIPYSIDRSANLCSCCLELFQIIGGEFPRKLVSPCAGAVLYSRLKADRYLLVEKS